MSSEPAVRLRETPKVSEGGGLSRDLETQTGGSGWVTPACLTAELLDELVVSLAEALYIGPEELEVDRKFTDLGMDSIIGVEWIRKINRKYGLAIPATKAYEYPCLREFAGFMARELELPSEARAEYHPVAGTTTIGQSKSGEFNAVSPAGTLPRGETLLDELVVSLAEILYLQPSEIDPDRKFIDLGMDSVIGVEWLRILNKRYEVAIAATRLYDCSSIRELAAYLEKERTNRQPIIPDNEPESLALTLEQVLEQVQNGTLDAGQADQLYRRFLQAESNP